MKISIIGAGNVGASVASMLVMKNLCDDIYLLDIAAEMAAGKAMDLNQSKFLFNSKCRVEGGGDYAKIADADMVVITAGLARKPGMSRDDLLFKNFEIVKECSEKIKASGRQPFVIVVSNPLDVMAYTAFKATGFPARKVLGMAGVLDTYRFMHYIQEKLGTKTLGIEALTLGSHGDTMVPVSSLSSVDDKPLKALMTPEELKVVEDRTKNGGAEIVALLKTGSAYYAPAASTVRMIEAIVNDENAVLPCSVYAGGDYGLDGMYIGLPVRLNKEGAGQAVGYELTADEYDQLKKSAAAIKEQIDKIRDKF